MSAEAGTRTDVSFTNGAFGKVAAAGATLAFEWWPGAGPLVCIHGLTSYRGAFAALADDVAPEIGVLAFDLRGRGDSDKPSGPYGIAQHASDIAAALDRLGVTGPQIMVGHSLGAFVVSAFAARFPERVKALVLVDGGHFFPIPPDIDPDVLLETVLGLFTERLKVVAPSVEAVIGGLEETPLYRGRVDDAVRRYFQSDLEPVPGGVRGKATEASSRADYRDLLTNPEIPANLGRINCPVLLLRAPEGLTGNGDAVIPDAIRDQMLAIIPDLTVVDLPGENHHTILFTLDGAQRSATAITDFIRTRGLL